MLILSSYFLLAFKNTIYNVFTLRFIEIYIKFQFWGSMLNILGLKRAGCNNWLFLFSSMALAKGKVPHKYVERGLPVFSPIYLHTCFCYK